MNNRCNMRSLSIFQITDKHVVDDCSQTGASEEELPIQLSGIAEKKLQS